MITKHKNLNTKLTPCDYTHLSLFHFFFLPLFLFLLFPLSSFCFCNSLSLSLFNFLSSPYSLCLLLYSTMVSHPWISLRQPPDDHSLNHYRKMRVGCNDIYEWWGWWWWSEQISGDVNDKRRSPTPWVSDLNRLKRQKRW